MAKAAKETVKAFSYLRTSSASNVGTDKDSDKRQREAIEAFARNSGFEIVAEFYDDAVKGTDAIDARKGFKLLLERIAGNGVRTVIVEDASRFARTLMVQEAGIAILVSMGVRVLTSRGDDLTDSDDEMRVAMRQIAGVFSQLEKTRLVKKLKGARDRKRQAVGKCEGRQSPSEQLRSRLLKGPASSDKADAWARAVQASLPADLAAKLPPDLRGPVSAKLADDLANGLARHLAKAVAEAKRLRRASPKTGERRSLREISAELAAKGFLNERGRPYNPNSIKAMIEG